MTLEQLEDSYWGPPPENSSRLVASCHELRMKDIHDLTTEELRLLVGQNIGLKFLVPLVIEILKVDPLAEGDYYEGDLIKALMCSEPEFWKENPRYKQIVIDIFEGARSKIKDLQTTDEIRAALFKAHDEFARP